MSFDRVKDTRLWMAFVVIPAMLFMLPFYFAHLVIASLVDVMCWALPVLLSNRMLAKEKVRKALVGMGVNL